MFAFSASAHSPSAVDHCVNAVFTGPQISNVIVARGRVLEIYDVLVDENGERTLNLNLEFKLSGVVTSMGVVRLNNSSVGAKGMDSLLLAFSDAKMSIVEYSPANASLVTVSLHYFEREEFRRELICEKGMPQVKVDPQSRCAAFSFYGDRMAILPFRQELAGEQDDLATSKFPFHPSYAFKLTDIDVKMKHLVDFVFLYDFLEPTLAILYETHQTWTGRLAARQDTRSLVVVSINTSKKTFPILYQSQFLPYNCTSLFAIPQPLGGVLVKSANALIYVDQTCLPGVVVAFNGFYGKEQSLPAPPAAECLGIPPTQGRDNLLYHKTNVTDYKDWAITLDCATAVLINPDTVLILNEDGEAILCEMVGHDDAGSGWMRRTGGVRRFRATRLGFRATFASSICRVSLPGKGYAGGKASLLRPYFDDLKSMAVVDIFLGSRVSDSILLRVVERTNGEFGDEGAGLQSALETKVKVTRHRYGRRAQEEEDDDDDLYGEKSTDKGKVGHEKLHGGVSTTSNGNGMSEKEPRFTMAIHDVLPGLGPIRDLAVGEFVRETTDEYTPGENTLRRELETVCCLGNGTHGAIGILSKSIRPEIHTTVDQEEIKAFKEVWTVRCRNHTSGRVSEDSRDDLHHKYLIMSNENSTTVLQTGREINQLTDSGFYTSGCSVLIASVLQDSAILQVQPNGVILLSHDAAKIESMDIGDTDTWIVSCSVSGNFVALLLCDGGFIVIRIEDPTRKLVKVFEKPDTSISCVSLVEVPAKSRLLKSVGEVLQQNAVGVENGNESKQTQAHDMKRKRGDFDDEDEDDLYGDSNRHKTENMEDVQETSASQVDFDPSTNRDQVFCFAYKEDGSLDVLLLPDLVEVFHVERFDFLGSTLKDTFDRSKMKAKEEQGVDINEILVTLLGAGDGSQQLYLMARTEPGDLIIYRSIIQEDYSVQPINASSSTPTTPVNTSQIPPLHRLALNFVRVTHNHISRELVVYLDTSGDKLKPAPKARPPAAFVKRHYLRAFRGIGHGPTDQRGGAMYDGVFMTGKKPCWIMACTGGGKLRCELGMVDGIKVPKGVRIENTPRSKGKGYLRVHPCVADGDIRTFAGLHNVNTPYGFVYINDKGLLRLCTIPWKYNYDLEWPMCKVALGRVPHKITYHFDSETYVMAAAVPSSFNLSKAQQAAALASGAIDAGFELNVVEERAKEDRSGLYFPSSGSYSLELLSPVDFQTVDSFAFEVDETVLCCQAVSLDSKQTTSGKKLFLAVGTGMCRGEDLTARGRILVFDIIDVVPDPNNPQSRHKFKLLHTADEKNPVTALCALNGYLVCAIGSRMIVYNFEDGESLNGIAFLDTNIYVTNLTSVKNTLVLTDITKGSWFCGYQEDPPKLRMLGKDYTPMETFGCEYVIDANTMGIIVSDQEKNLHILSYMPDSFQSFEGQKLIRKGEIHLGTKVQKFLRLRKLPIGRAKTGAVVHSKQFFCIGGCLDGSMLYTIPCTEKLYQRLYVVYSRMVNTLQPLAGLNPRGFRQAQLRHKPLTTLIGSGPPGPKSMLDGDMLLSYLSLPLSVQKDIAKGVGSTADRVVDDLMEVFSGTDYF